MVHSISVCFSPAPCPAPLVQVEKADRDNLSVQVQWSNYGSRYWVYYYCCQLLPVRAPESGAAPVLKVGDKVRVKRSVSTPR